MKPTNFISGLAITALALFAPLPEAQAAERGTILGYDAEIIQSGTMQAPDFINIYGPAGKEQITVTCAPFDWQSYGANTVQWADRIARHWCFGG